MQTYKVRAFVDDVLKDKHQLSDEEACRVTAALRHVTDKITDGTRGIYEKAASDYIQFMRDNKLQASLPKRSVKQTQGAPAAQRLTSDPGSSIINTCPICHKPYTVVELPGGVKVKYCVYHRIVVPFPGDNKVTYQYPKLQNGLPVY